MDTDGRQDNETINTRYSKVIYWGERGYIKKKWGDNRSEKFIVWWCNVKMAMKVKSIELDIALQ